MTTTPGNESHRDDERTADPVDRTEHGDVRGEEDTSSPSRDADTIVVQESPRRADSDAPRTEQHADEQHTAEERTAARTTANSTTRDQTPVTQAYDRPAEADAGWAPEPSPRESSGSPEQPHREASPPSERSHREAAATPTSHDGDNPYLNRLDQTRSQGAPQYGERLPEYGERDGRLSESSPQPVFVQAPTRPKPAGNRGAGTLIAVLAAVVFAVLYAVVVALLGAARSTDTSRFVDDLTRYVQTPSFWFPIVFFAIAMVLLVLILNRAGWWAYILGGFVVAVVVYFGFMGGALLQTLFQRGSLEFPAAELRAFVAALWLNPFGIAGAIVAREVTIWFGLWIAARGKRVKARNAQRQADYDREMESSRRLTTVDPRG